MSVELTKEWEAEGVTWFTVRVGGKIAGRIVRDPYLGRGRMWKAGGYDVDAEGDSRIDTFYALANYPTKRQAVDAVVAEFEHWVKTG